MNPLIECVPNFSEGRSTEILEAIRDSIENCKGIELWDHSADPDHNRSVFTLAGSPEKIEECVCSFVKTANRLINMSTHTGVHPCIGAADVIPLIPLRDTGMKDCVSLAEKIGKRLAKENEMPIYLYAEAARTPSHKRLADIRRGGYHKLKEEIKIDPERTPDFGPCDLPPFGGASVGARDFLIAWNVYLNTTDLLPAKRIASAIRESSGGFPGLQAIGLPVHGKAQVSMNILNYKTAPMGSVFDRIKELALSDGITVSHSELIGLLPQAALEGISPEYIRLNDFAPNRIIEKHL